MSANAGDAGDAFDPWVEKIHWRRKWQPNPVLLPGEPHRQRSLGSTVHGMVDLDLTKHV